MTHEEDYSDYFLGYVPAFAIFGCRVDDIEKLVKDIPSNTMSTEQKTLLELSFIGISAYFETFCKENFASVINICPKILENLVASRPDLSIKVSETLKVLDGLERRLGNLIAEQFDFGKPNEINSLYRGLLGITPLRTSEKSKLDLELRDRHLLVHHGGIITIRYAGSSPESRSQRLHADSVVITKQKLIEYVELLKRVAFRITTSSKSALDAFVKSHSIPLSSAAQEAMGAITWDVLSMFSESDSSKQKTP